MAYSLIGVDVAIDREDAIASDKLWTLTRIAQAEAEKTSNVVTESMSLLFPPEAVVTKHGGGVVGAEGGAAGGVGGHQVARYFPMNFTLDSTKNAAIFKKKVTPVGPQTELGAGLASWFPAPGQAVRRYIEHFSEDAVGGARETENFATRVREPESLLKDMLLVLLELQTANFQEGSGRPGDDRRAVRGRPATDKADTCLHYFTEAAAKSVLSAEANPLFHAQLAMMSSGQQEPPTVLVAPRNKKQATGAECLPVLLENAKRKAADESTDLEQLRSCYESRFSLCRILEEVGGRIDLLLEFYERTSIVGAEYFDVSDGIARGSLGRVFARGGMIGKNCVKYRVLSVVWSCCCG